MGVNMSDKSNQKSSGGVIANDFRQGSKANLTMAFRLEDIFQEYD
jgi:hypothetical protein